MTDASPACLAQLLDRLRKTTQQGSRVSMADLLDEVGPRSFGVLLLVAGLITLMPLVGDIPGVPTVMAVFVVLVAGQLLLRRRHLWFPEWLLNRSVGAEKLETALDWLERPAQFIDRWLQPRLQWLTHRAAAYPIAIACLFVAALMPVMEVIPFSANLAGAALTAFGLSLITNDGLLALLAFGCTLTAFGLIVYNLL
ncbi:MAG: exopolysaccharide biosynthesis protein [Bacteroidetes bacterium]|nr:exopolysaccharide biosynthesis protein [Bacteroidota bacterium]